MKNSLTIFLNVQISLVRIVLHLQSMLFLKSCFKYTAVLFEFVLVDLGYIWVIHFRSAIFLHSFFYHLTVFILT